MSLCVSRPGSLHKHPNQKGFRGSDFNPRGPTKRRARFSPSHLFSNPRAVTSCCSAPPTRRCACSAANSCHAIQRRWQLMAAAHDRIAATPGPYRQSVAARRVHPTQACTSLGILPTAVRLSAKCCATVWRKGASNFLTAVRFLCYLLDGLL